MIDSGILTRLFAAVWICAAALGSAVADEGEPSLRPLCDDDYDAGLVLVDIRTGEKFDFNAPVGASVCEDWEAFGAACDWFRTELPATSSDDPSERWSCAFGANVVEALTVFSYGTMRPAMTNLLTFISPFEASLGIVPADKYDCLDQADCPSRFWQYHTPSNTYVMTWQNVLLDRLVNRPVSFQAEIAPDGRTVFRYDLSRLSEDVITNAVVGIYNCGHGRVFTRIPRRITSLTWARLIPEMKGNEDPDGDGLGTSYELFACGTDPYSADTDGDGIRDGVELNVTQSNPRDPYSINGKVVDSIAAALGGADPLSCPGDGSSTAIENAFYTGDPNREGERPVSVGGQAVLRVTSTGNGRGELIVGDKIVPLVEGCPTLSVAVRRGERVTIKYHGDKTIACELDSDDFCIGELPSGWLRSGWIAFPNVEASHPCIHQLDANKVKVSLDPGFDVDDLFCVWNGNDDEVKVNPLSPLSAEIQPLFKRNARVKISYTLSHPDYMFGQTTYKQDCGYCPEIVDEVGSSGFYSATEDYFEDEDEEPPESDPMLCAIHNMHYSECADRHLVDFDVATNGIQLADVLKLHHPDFKADHRLIDVHVPTGSYHCCSCPDHWQNSVTIRTKDHHVSVHLNDKPFYRTTEDCTLDVCGAAPSSNFQDSFISLCKTGVVYETHNYTVFGVGITGMGHDLRRLNTLNPDFGLPITVQTDALRAPMIGVRTDVDLPYGTIRLAFTDVTAHIQLLMYREDVGYTVVLDSKENPCLEMSLAEWKKFAKSGTHGRTTEFVILAHDHGHARLFFGYAAEYEGAYACDSAEQMITVVRTPLLPDFNRDGKLGLSDEYQAVTGRPKYFWCNNDTWHGDNAFKEYEEWSNPWPYQLESSGDDMLVNGRNDLVNQCPIGFDVSAFVDAWGTDGFVFKLSTNVDGDARVIPVDVDWNELRKLVREDIKTVFGGALHSAEFTSIVGYQVPEELLLLGKSGRGALAVEFLKPRNSQILALEILDKKTESVIFQQEVTMRILDVHDMYRWINLVGECGDSDDAKFNTRSSVEWPDSAHANANVVFVHGFNMHPQEAWDWSQAVFKRLWWSGMDAGFTAVRWRGNHGQKWIPKVPGVTDANGYGDRNYYQNVLNAFRSAKGLSAACASILPKDSKKYFIAHSLGNMLVCAARQFHGLEYEKYMMLNAAVPIEACDDSPEVISAAKASMTPEDWRSYPDKVKASHWYELFSDSDPRHKLTWKGLFKDVDNTINFYSSKDEVVANGDGEDKPVLAREFAWYNQERNKGFPLVDLTPEAGWRFGSGYKVWFFLDYTPNQAAEIDSARLIETPFFGPFTESGVLGPSGGDFLADKKNELFKYRIYSHGIPAESFAIGANPVPKWNNDNTMDDEGDSDNEVRNFNMAVKCNPIADSDDVIDWTHSYFVQRPLKDVWVLYDKFSEQIGMAGTEGE